MRLILSKDLSSLNNWYMAGHNQSIEHSLGKRDELLFEFRNDGFITKSMLDLFSTMIGSQLRQKFSLKMENVPSVRGRTLRARWRSSVCVGRFFGQSAGLPSSARWILEEKHFVAKTGRQSDPRSTL